MALGGRLAVDVEQLKQALAVLRATKGGGEGVKVCFRNGELAITRGISAARAAATGSWEGVVELQAKSLSRCVDVASREGAANLRFEASGGDLALTFNLPGEGGRISTLSVHAKWSK